MDLTESRFVFYFTSCMKNIKTIRVTAVKNDDPQKITIQGVWGGHLDVDHCKTNIKGRAVVGPKSETILAYLPPYVRNVIMEPDGFLINSAPGISFRVYLLDKNNNLVRVIMPGRIGQSDLWQCRVPPRVFSVTQKIIINREGNKS